jgi:hypothetical protein
MQISFFQILRNQIYSLTFKINMQARRSRHKQTSIVLTRQRNWSENSNIFPIFGGKKVANVTIQDTMGERDILKAQEWWEEVANKY